MPRSFGLAVPDHLGVLLLQQAAYIAVQLAVDGQLLSASPRAAIGDGDFHILNTVRGDYVLIRSTSAAGAIEPTSRAGNCDPTTSINVPYVVLPPVLVGLWQIVLGEHWTWPEATTGAHRQAPSWRFTTAGVSSHTLASATCDTAELLSRRNHCTMLYRGRRYSSSVPARISISTIERRAPSANSGPRDP
jgi:hypothetical protein